MPRMDRKTGRITSDDSHIELEFKGHKILYREDSAEVEVSYEPLSGIKMALYNDLEVKGFSGEDADRIMLNLKQILESVGFAVEVL